MPSKSGYFFDFDPYFFALYCYKYEHMLFLILTQSGSVFLFLFDIIILNVLAYSLYNMGRVCSPKQF